MVAKGGNLLQAMAATNKETAEWVRREGSAESPFQDFPGMLVTRLYKVKSLLTSGREF
jgi:hypothetical protein